MAALLEVKKSFKERVDQGCKLSGTVSIKPIDDPRYVSFAERIRRMNRCQVWPMTKHPLENQVNTWYPNNAMRIRPATLITEIDHASTIHWIDQPKDFAKMMEHLQQQQIMAFDLEMAIFKGYWYNHPCLMQISTLTRDFLVCPFSLQTEIESLSKITMDQTKLKLFFAAANDIRAFQLQWKLFFVGMIDLQHVFKEFYPRKCEEGMPSFEKVVNTFFEDYEMDKTLQICDWRVRPLNNQMKNYARDDTHLLLRTWLAITYHHMIPEDSTAWIRIIRKCNEMVKVLPNIKPYPSFPPVLHRVSSNPTFDQSLLFEQIYSWRQKVAAEEDEMPETIMKDKDVYECCVVQPQSLYSDHSKGPSGRGLSKTVVMNCYLYKHAKNLLEIIKRHVAVSEDQPSPKRLKSVVVKITNKLAEPNVFFHQESWEEVNTENGGYESDPIPASIPETNEMEWGVQDIELPSTAPNTSHSECEVQDTELPSVYPAAEKVKSGVQDFEPPVTKLSENNTQEAKDIPNQSVYQSEELEELLQLLGSKYDDTPVEDIIHGRTLNGAKNLKIRFHNNETSPERQVSSEEEILDPDNSSTGICYLCYLPGHRKQECEYNDPNVKNLPATREIINKNKKAFYDARPVVKAKRSRGRRLKYRENKAFEKFNRNSEAEQNPMQAEMVAKQPFKMTSAVKQSFKTAAAAKQPTTVYEASGRPDRF